MATPEWLFGRLSAAREILSPWVQVVIGAEVAIGVLDTFLPAVMDQPPALIPRLPFQTWALIVCVTAVLGMVEGSYRGFRTRDSKIHQAEEERDLVAARLEDVNSGAAAIERCRVMLIRQADAAESLIGDTSRMKLKEALRWRQETIEKAREHYLSDSQVSELERIFSGFPPAGREMGGRQVALLVHRHLAKLRSFAKRL